MNIQSQIIYGVQENGPQVIFITDWETRGLANVSWRELTKTFGPKDYFQCEIFHLTLSQTTNFRLFQTERVCRRQFQIWWKSQKVLQMGKNTVGKGEKLLVMSNFSIYHNVFKRLVQKTRKTWAFLGGLKHTGYLLYNDWEAIIQFNLIALGSHGTTPVLGWMSSPKNYNRSRESNLRPLQLRRRCSTSQPRAQTWSKDSKEAKIVKRVIPHQ